MHDLLHENQARLQPDLLQELADTLPFDVSQFAADLQGEAVAAKVAHGFERGVRSGVGGTPSFFVKGQKLTTYGGTCVSLREAVAR